MIKTKHVLFLIADSFFIILLWLAAPREFISLVAIIIFFTLLILVFDHALEVRKKRKQNEAIRAFLENADEVNTKILASLCDKAFHNVIYDFAAQINAYKKSAAEGKLELKKYQEFIEAWAHEMKTPLSTAMLVLANNKDEMDSYVHGRMEHVRRALGNGIDQILYYARLDAPHVDYKYEKTEIKELVLTALEDFSSIAEEKNINVNVELSQMPVVSDAKVVSFMLKQIFSNAFKYANADKGYVNITNRDDSASLVVRNDCEGVASEDLPFLFDKGFTGNHSQKQRATGMGLYFVKQYADALSASVEIQYLSVEQTPSSQGGEFEIKLSFPIIQS